MSGGQAAEAPPAGLKPTARPGSILERTAHGAAWVIGWRLATRLIGVINTLVLVRLLVPADFGIVALGYSFVSSLDQLCTVGIEDAIVRADRADRELYDTGFTLNLLRALAMGAALAAGAGAIARVFGDPRLEGIVLVFAAMTAVTGLTNIGTIDFRRYIAFDKEFVLQIVPRILSVGVALTVGIVWRSYWALVAGIASVTVLGVVFSYWMHPYRPRLAFGAWRRLAGFSLWMWVLGLISLLRSQTPILIIGRLMGPTSVGILSIGSEVASLPTTELILPLTRASFPGFSEVRRSGDDGGATFLRMLGAMALITLPAGIGISAVAFPVIKLAFGAAWMKAVPLVQILGVSGMLGLFGWISYTLFAAHAWMRPMAKMSGAATIVCALLVALLGARFGLLGAAIGMAIADAFGQVVYLVATLRRLELRLMAVFACVWRSLLATAIMALVLACLRLGWTNVVGGGWVLGGRLLGAAAIGAAVYGVAVLGLWVVAGRPPGAETDLLAVAARMARRAGTLSGAVRGALLGARRSA